jgi:Raf kinase inhibitor-like YbhB/YbcL family protein
MFQKVGCIVMVFSIFCFCQNKKQSLPQKEEEKKMDIEITSTAFNEGGMIPTKYTCDGPDISPPLAWSSVPENTMSIALICDDPDTPVGTWVHWVLFNLLPETKELPENLPTREILSNGAKQGRNGSRRIGYSGPCPPGGTHRYYFKIYALNTKLDLEPDVEKKELVEAMEGHILAEGQLMGRYQRQ